MLNNLFKRPTIIRMEQGDYDRHIATVKGEAKTLADMRVAKLEIERDIAERNYNSVTALYDKVAQERDTVKAIATRALTLLKEVDTTRTGGKPLREARERLFTDTMLAGLWGEEKQ